MTLAITLEIDWKKDLTQRIKGYLQNLIFDWNVAVETDSGLQQDSRGTLSCPAPASASWSAKTSGIIIMKTLGESLHCNSHVSKLRSLQSNLRMQEVLKLELPQVLVLPALVLRRKLLLGRPKQMSSQKIIVHLHQHQHHLRIIKYT